MKRLFYILLLTVIMPMQLMAQKDLNIGRVLDGRYKKNPQVTDVVVTGQRLSGYSLNYYHSLTVNGDAQIMNDIAQAFKDDEPKATDKELSTIGGKLFSGFYQLEYNGEVNRFVFFKDMRQSPSDKRNAVMIIYMEGNTSLSALKRRFKQ